jgi:dipeptidyl aminopeptidase/acylaminoacyl peptidase
MPLFRTRFNQDIVAEFTPPVGDDTGKVIILCDGMPSVPAKKQTVRFWAKRGFWVFHPRYRGSWESAGQFLAQSPVEDIKDVISGIHEPMKNPWDGKVYECDPEQVFVFGSSFGGTTALMASLDERVDAVVSLSPVIDWTVEMENEPLDWLRDAVRDSFGEAYRFTDEDWGKLQTGKFFNPVNHIEEMKGEKILIIHAKDDDLIPWKPVKRFSEDTESELVLRRGGGHLSASDTSGFFLSLMIRWFLP